MRMRRAGAIVSIVSAERTCLRVELDSRIEPIQGQILDSRGTAHEFSGYMGLIEALERLRARLRNDQLEGWEKTDEA